MRLKDISIKAFRLFEDEHVEFVNRRFAEKGSADLVSIYAPNGFGKTSFFDAIEFCVTKNVKRLKFNNFDENLRSDSKLNDIGSFIHNKKMPGEKVKVRIGIDGQEEPAFMREVNVEDEKRLLSSEGQNLYFSNAFLLQDWFSEFLSVTNAEDRFKLFMQNFAETKDLLDYHSDLKSNYVSIGKDLGKKKKDLQNKRKSITERIDGQFVEEIDKLVETLTALGTKLSWKRQINDNELGTLKRETAQALYQTGTELKQVNLAIENCSKADAEQGGLVAPVMLETRRKELESLDTRLKGLRETKEKVLRLKALLAEIDQLTKERAILDEKASRLDYLIKNYTAFTELLKKIEDHEKDTTKYQEEIKLNGETLTKANEKKVQTDVLLAEIQKQITIIVNKLTALNVEYANYQKCKKEIETIQTEKSGLAISVKTKHDEHTNAANRLTEIQNIQKTILARSVTELIVNHEDDSKQLIELDRQIKKSKQEIAAIDENVRKQNDYQNQVKTLLLHSREMIDQLKTGVCPLCGHDYQSMECLMDSVVNNKAISSAIEELLRKKSELNTLIQQKEKEKEEIYKRLEQQIGVKVEKAKADEKAIQQELEKLAKRVSECDAKITELTKRIDTDYKDFKDLTQEQVSLALAQEKEKLEKNKKEEGGNLTELKGKIKTLTESIAKDEEKITEIKKKVSDIKNQAAYIDYIEKLDGQKATDSQREAWTIEIDSIQKRRAEHKSKMSEAQEKSKKLTDEQISPAMETALDQEIEALDINRDYLAAKIFNTISFFVNECKVSGIGQDSTTDVILSQFKQAKESFDKRKDLLLNRQKLLGEYQNLIAIAERYNMQQKAEKEIAELAEAIQKEESLYDEIEQERKDLERYLERFVQNYFQLDLINKLYNTIDPHPEYKEIEFKCDFTNKKPRLNVVMGSKNSTDDKIIPNLYFSTAQVNILSFCIFMAKAMFATTDTGEDLGCIFIDDPIQALDDINILSMIDLLRNIAFTQKKQIVITTHDLNFFELLQKKIPQDKFNACYLQLKERGKFSVVD